MEPFEVKLYADGEIVCLEKDHVTGYRRVLDLRTGLLTRSFTYTTEKGVKLSLKYERFVSLAEKHTAAMRVTVSSDRACVLKIDSILDGQIKKIDLSDGEKGAFLDDCFYFLSLKNEDGVVSATNKTKISAFTITTAMAEQLGGVKPIAEIKDKYFVNRYELNAAADTAYTLERVICYATNRDFDEAEVETKTRALTKSQANEGFDKLFAAHKAE